MSDIVKQLRDNAAVLLAPRTAIPTGAIAGALQMAADEIERQRALILWADDISYSCCNCLRYPRGSDQSKYEEWKRTVERLEPGYSSNEPADVQGAEEVTTQELAKRLRQCADITNYGRLDDLQQALHDLAADLDSGAFRLAEPPCATTPEWMPRWLREMHCKCGDGQCVACQAADLLEGRTTEPPTAALLVEAARLLEFATYHDGRYNQTTDEQWQAATIDWQNRAATVSGRKRYSDMWQPAVTKVERCPHGYTLANLKDGTDTCTGCNEVETPGPRRQSEITEVRELDLAKARNAVASKVAEILRSEVISSPHAVNPDNFRKEK